MKIILIDDDPIVSMSLKTILDQDEAINVCAVGHDGDDLFALYQRHMPDIVLMDIRMKHMTGLEAARQLLGQYPEAKIVFLTTFIDDEYIEEALVLGAKGYILKQDFENIILALKAVMSGQSVFGSDVVSKLQTRSTVSHFAESLTAKEREIVVLVADGLSNREIAQALFLSEGTVRNYISTILDKLQLRDRTQLVVHYYKHS